MAGSKIVRKGASSGPVLERHPLEAADLTDTFADPNPQPERKGDTAHTDTEPALVDTSSQIDYEAQGATVRTDPEPALVDTSGHWEQPSVDEYSKAGYGVTPSEGDAGDTFASALSADSPTPPGEVRLVEHYDYGVDDGLTPNERAAGKRPKNEANVKVVGEVRTETTVKSVKAAPRNKAASVEADK